MNKSILFLLLIISSFSVYSEESPKTSCELLEESARQVMTARQLGMPLREMVEITKSTSPAMLGLVKIAYNRPQYRVKVNQDREINSFANRMYLICLETSKD